MYIPAHKNGEVVDPAGGETGGPRSLAEVYNLPPKSTAYISIINLTFQVYIVKDEKPKKNRLKIHFPKHIIHPADLAGLSSSSPFDLKGYYLVSVYILKILDKTRHFY